jgi:hypothetical protein
MIYKPQLNRLAALALIILIPVGGCIWGSVQYDRTLEKELIKNIEPGKTTRKNILEWFGPPEILARKDGVVLLPPLETGQGKMRQVDSIVFFKYFLERHPIAEQHVVYYYFNEWEKIGGVSIPIPGLALASLPLTSGNLQSRELWVLVNRKTGRVEDYVFLEGAEK